MAWEFFTTPTATIKAKSANSTDIITIKGVTTASITPTAAAQQINKLLNIGGKAIVADSNMTRTQIEEAVDNG